MVFEKLKEILAEQLDVDADSITKDSMLIEDLGADSLDAIDIVMSVEDEFKIVGSAEADIDAKPKSISNDSPVGAALLGKSIDEITNVEAPGGLMKVKIISIRR